MQISKTASNELTKKLTIEKPTAAKRTIITETDKAFKDYTKSFEIEIRDDKDPLKQLTETKKFDIEYKLLQQLHQLKGFKLIQALKIIFEKITSEDLIIKTAYFNNKVMTVTNINDLNMSEANEEILLNKIAGWISEGSGWLIKDVDGHYINIVTYEPLKGSSYINLPRGLKNPSKGLIKLQNEDNESFRWCHIRHLNQQTTNPQRI